MLQDPSPRRRWPRSQRFALTDKGRDAEASYRSSIVSSRSQEGRASFDAARSTWAELSVPRIRKRPGSAKFTRSPSRRRRLAVGAGKVG